MYINVLICFVIRLNKYNFLCNYEILFVVYFDYIIVECCFWSLNDIFVYGIYLRVSMYLYIESCKDLRNEIILN